MTVNNKWWHGAIRGQVTIRLQRLFATSNSTITRLRKIDA